MQIQHLKNQNSWYSFCNNQIISRNMNRRSNADTQTRMWVACDAKISEILFSSRGLWDAKNYVLHPIYTDHEIPVTFFTIYKLSFKMKIELFCWCPIRFWKFSFQHRGQLYFKNDFFLKINLVIPLTFYKAAN